MDLHEAKEALQDIAYLAAWNKIMRVEDAVWDPRGKRALFAGLDVKKPRILFLGAADGYEAMQLAAMYPGGEIVLGGFYSEPVSFTFPPAFLREARIRIAAQWKEQDLTAITEFANSGRLDLDGLITHREPAARAADAYATAFGDPHCVKMILDWRSAV
jgi:3-hydroxyethyl bacteriochlorophyllide a dehydrogenase